MSDLLHYFNQYASLDKPALDDVLKDVKSKTVKKGDYLLKQGQVCRYLYFLNEGLLKLRFNKNEKEFVMRFFWENLLFSAFESYLTQAPSNYDLIALEDTTVTLISHDRMEELCKKHHGIETFTRKLVSRATVKMTRRISEILEENATEGYNQFVKEHKSIIQRISLGDLASYLGITQQSLSRIRAKK